MEQIFKINIEDSLGVKITPTILNACIMGFKGWGIASMDITDKYKGIVSSYEELLRENEIPILPEKPIVEPKVPESKETLPESKETPKVNKPKSDKPIS